MNNEHWNSLLDVIAGKKPDGLPTGFIIDSPWLPGWYGINTLDYYTSDQLWFEANKKAIETFKDAMFLPGFWSEYGMCTEPSAFGAKCRWENANLPHAAANHLAHLPRAGDKLAGSAKDRSDRRAEPL